MRPAGLKEDLKFHNSGGDTGGSEASQIEHFKFDVHGIWTADPDPCLADGRTC